MADIAQLGIAYDGSGLNAAKADLQAIVPPAERAQKAADGVGSALDRAAGGATTASAALNKAAGAATAEAAAMNNAANGTNNATAAFNDLANSQGALGAKIKASNDNLGSFDSHIIAYRTHLDNVGKSLKFSGTEALNFSRQLSDIGVTAAMGMSPLMIAIQQGPQLFDILQFKATQTGKSIGEVFKIAGAQVMEALLPILPYVAALAVAVGAGVVVWKLFSKEAVGAGTDIVDNLAEIDVALAKVKFSTGALANAQTILGNYMDVTTGKINNQSQALRDLSLAQAMVAKIQAQVRQQEARAQLDDMAAQKLMIGGGPMGLTVGTGFRPEAGIIDAFQKHEMSAKSALTQLERLKDMGQLTNKSFLSAAQAVANFNVETENIKVYDNLKDAINGDQGALQGFLKPNKTKPKKGPKTDAEKFGDIATSGLGDIAELKAKIAAVDMTSEAGDRLVATQKLMNEAQQKGIKLTPAQISVLQQLGATIGDLTAKLRNLQGFREISNGLDKQLGTVKQAGELIGVYGEQLIRDTIIQNAMNDAISKNIVLTQLQIATITGKADAIAKATVANQHDQFIEDAVQNADALQASMERERSEIGLTGAALISYQYESNLLLQAKQKHINLSPAEIAAIHASADAYGAMRDEINRTKEALDFARGTAKGFLTDLTGNLREGQSVWEAFGNAAVNALNKIIDKLLDSAFDSLLDGVFGGNKSGGGDVSGILGGFLGGLLKSANGNAFGRNGVQTFANGGSFANSIVDKPTAFAFGAGGSNLGIMGEAGPEAILPLERGPDGQLGVSMVSGGGKSAGAVQIVVTAEEGAMFVPRVKAISEDTAVHVTQTGIAMYDQTMPERVQSIADDQRAR